MHMNVEAAKMRGSDNDEVVDAVDDVTHYLEAEADMCCASCGIAEVDDIRLNECNDCDLVRYCSDRCQKVIDQNTRQYVKKGWLNYAMRFYLGSLKAAIWATVRSAFYHFRLTQSNLSRNHVAAKQYAKDVHTPIGCTREINGNIPRVHFVVNSYQTLRKKPTRI